MNVPFTFLPDASSEVSFQMVLETGSSKFAQLLPFPLYNCHCGMILFMLW